MRLMKTNLYCKYYLLTKVRDEHEPLVKTNHLTGPKPFIISGFVIIICGDWFIKKR
jgi:hypothetical protein